jgi:hypothetical protein
MYTLNKSIRSKFEMSLEPAENLSEDIDSSETDINNANNATHEYSQTSFSHSLSHTFTTANVFTKV